MPPIKKRRPKGANTSTRLPIPTLSGGVGRQAPSKRTPFEAENIDNCFVTIEKSIEKRSGFEAMRKFGGDSFSLFNSDSTSIGNYFFYWLNIDVNNRFVIIINYKARGSLDKLITIYRIVDNMWEDVSPVYQWDPTDPSLAWNGTDVIEETDIRYYIYSLALSIGSGVILNDYNTALNYGVVSLISREYITFGSSSGDTGKIEYTPQEALRIVSLGTNTIILNTLVYAGFSSTEDGFLINKNGYATAQEDIKGREITYYTAAKIIKTNLGRLYPQGTTLPSGETADPNFTAKYIPVEDYTYAEIDRSWLGQSVEDFSEIRFPPDKNDWYANNSDLDQSPPDNKAKLMLQALYDDDHPHKAGNYPVEGRGKIYYCAGPYLSQPSGYYRIINFPETETYDPDGGDALPGITGTGRPYTQRVRTPDAFSYLDPSRMPQNLLFNNLQWSLAPIEWTPRTTGNRYTNPGPSPFLADDKKTVRPARISCISVFRDRLFFSVDDIIFSSQLGDYQNLWINDPTSITTADPIDIRASLNQYAQITSLTPFDEFLFINTKGNVQLELRGSQNVISPLTAEISPTTFYATAPLVEPILIGSQIYFFDSRRLYVYYSQKVRGLNTAIEVSAMCPDYLPTTYGCVCTAAAQDTIMVTDAEAKNNIYLYTNRYSGERVLQSAFYRFVLNSNEQVVSMQSYDNYLLCVIFRANENRFYLARCLLQINELDVPKMDFYSKFTVPSSLQPSLTHMLTIPYTLPYDKVYVVLGSDFGDLQGTTFLATVNNEESTATVTITGIDLSQHASKTVYIGGSFLMNVELSQQFVRDDGNNSVNGVLNLRTLVTRHRNTGHYKVIVNRQGRPLALESEFNYFKLNYANSMYEVDGEFVNKVYGFSDTTTVKIQSDYPSPFNIVQMEFKGKFKQTYTSLR